MSRSKLRAVPICWPAIEESDYGHAATLSCVRVEIPNDRSSRRPPKLWCLRVLAPILFGTAFACVTASSIGASPSIIGGPYAVLEQGTKGGYEWRAFASPMRPWRKQSLPCINVSVERELRPISEAEVFMLCGTVKPFPTVMQVGVGSGEKRVTVAGIALDRDVRMVKIPLSDGSFVRRAPRVISKRSARKAHVEPFAFLVFAVARGLSIGPVVGYDARGRLVSGRLPK